MVNPYSSVTELQVKSRRPEVRTGRLLGTQRVTNREQRDPSGWLCWVSAPIWDVFLLVRLVIMEDGSAHAMVPTMTFLVAHAKDPLLYVPLFLFFFGL